MTPLYPQGGGACRGQATPHDRVERDRPIRKAAQPPTAGLYPEELAAAKAYMVAEDDDDIVVMNCVMAARVYLEGAGVALPPAGSGRRALYDMACHALALAYYEHRGEIGTDLPENPILRQTINQLKLTEPPVSGQDAGGTGGEGDHGEERDGGGAADPDTGIPSTEPAG